jgi:hypothetical protein
MKLSKISEMRLVICSFGIVALMSIPHFVGASKNRDAAQIVNDFNTVLKAAMTSFTVTDEFPASADWGKLPPELVPFLPSDFTFQQHGVAYRWRRWSLPSGLPNKPSQHTLVGLQVRTDDPQLLGSLICVYQGRLTQLKKDQVTFVIL